MVFCALVQYLRYSSALFVNECESTTRHRVTLSVLYFIDILFQVTDAQRGTFVVAQQPSNHQTLHCAHHG